jgi:hypothetical protein
VLCKVVNAPKNDLHIHNAMKKNSIPQKVFCQPKGRKDYEQLCCILCILIRILRTTFGARTANADDDDDNDNNDDDGNN